MNRDNIHSQGLSDTLRGGAGGRLRFKKSPSPSGFNKRVTGSLSGISVDDVVNEAQRAADGLPRVNTGKITSQIGGNNAAAIAGAGVAAAAAAAGVAAVTSQDKTEERLEAVENTLNKAGMLAWLGPGAVGLAGGAIKKVGDWTNAGWLQRAGAATKNGVQSFNEVELGQFSKKVGAGGWFTKTTQPVTNGVATFTEKVSNALGLGKWRSEANTRKAAAAHAKAVELVGKIDLAHAPSELHAPLQEIIAFAKAPSPAHIHGEELMANSEAWTRGMKALSDNKTTLSAEAKTLVKQTGKLQKHLGDVLHFTGRSGTWNNIGETIRGVPQSISKAKMSHSLLNGAFVAGSSVSAVSHGHSYWRDVDTLREMAHAVTGKEYSKWDIVTGNIPTGVPHEFGKLTTRAFSKIGADLANIVLQLSSRFHGGAGMALMGATAGATMIADMAFGTDIIDAYRALSAAHKNGVKLSKDDYAAFIALAGAESKNKELNKLDPTNAGVQALAEKYAAENRSPGEVLKFVSTKQLADDLHALIAANEAKAPKAAETPATAAGDKKWAHEFAAKADKTLAKNDPAAAPQAAMPVVGAHTAKVNAQAQAAHETVRTV